MNNTIVSVDVIIPAYNAARYIHETTQSVLDQTYPIHKIIIVDDGSTDNTIEVIKKFDDSKILIIENKENKGVSATRNKGIEASSADFISFVDADDVWTADKIEKQIKVFLESAHCPGVVYCGYEHINSQGEVISANTVKPFLKGDIFKMLLSGNYISGSASSVIMKRECVNEVGLLRTDLFYGEDWDYWLRLSNKFNFDYVDDVLVKVRIHETNAQHGKHGDEDRLKRFLEQELSVVATWSKTTKIPYKKYLSYYIRAFKLSSEVNLFNKFADSNKHISNYISYYKNYYLLTCFITVCYIYISRLVYTAK